MYTKHSTETPRSVAFTNYEPPFSSRVPRKNCVFDKSYANSGCPIMEGYSAGFRTNEALC